jgi:L-lactate dehydrogenase complex protein LldG
MSPGNGTVPRSSRERILRRIRAANERAGAQSQPIPREYQRSGDGNAFETLALFEERVREYDARVFPVRRAEIAQRAAEILSEVGRRRMAVPAGLPAEWRASGIEWVMDGAGSTHEDAALSYEVLDGVDGAMTGAALGIAVSGSIVLQHGPSEGRRVLTLLPDYHLCILQASDVVETLPEGFARLDPLRPTTFISGPSATADIEMVRIKGVHGPRWLDVLLVED